MRFGAGFLPRGEDGSPSRRYFARYEKKNGTRQRAKSIFAAVLYCDYTAKCTYTHAPCPRFAPILRRPPRPIMRREVRQSGRAVRAGIQRTAPLSSRTAGRRVHLIKPIQKTVNGKQQRPITELQLSYIQSDYTAKTILRMKNNLCAFNTAPRSARLRLGGIKARGGAVRLSSGGLPPLAA